MNFDKIFEEFDDWLKEENKEGVIGPGYVTLRVVGQGALFLADINLKLRATKDLDAFVEAKHAVVIQLGKILKAHGLSFDHLSNEIWMPDETKYVDVFDSGYFLTVKRAGVEYIMISKAKMAPEKNKELIANYIAEGKATEEFFTLAQKYDIDLEGLLDGY